MKSNSLSNKKTKVIFLSLFVAIFFFFYSSNIESSNNGTVNISVSPNQITSQGATSTTANISVSSNYPIANYLLTVTVNGNVVSTPTGIGLTEATSHTISPITINLAGPGNYVVAVHGQLSVNNGNDYMPVDVSNSVQVTVSAPAPTPTPVPTPAPTPKPTTKPTTRATTKSTTQTKPTTKSTSTKSQDSNDKNYRDINKKMILTSDLDIRSDASLSSTYLGSYDKGTVVDVIGITDNGWYVINYNGKTAYLAGSYLEDYSSPSSTKADEEESNSEETTTTSKNDDESKTSTTNKDDKADKTKKTEKSNTEKTSTDKDSPALINNNDSDMNAGNSNKSLFAKLDPTMLVIFGLLLLLIILLIVYYILKRRILADEEQEEFEELPGDNNEAIYANKSSDIEVSRVDDSKSSEK